VLLGRLFQSAAEKSALLVIDVQDCFLEKDTTSGSPGSLEVPASHIIPLINSMRQQKSCLFDEVIFTQDYHPGGHISFASSHGLSPFAHLDGKGSLPLTCILPDSGAAMDAACCPTTLVDNSSVDCETQLCAPNSFTYPPAMTDNPACTTCVISPELCFETTQAMWTDHCLQTGDSTFPPSLDKRTEDLVVQKGKNQFVDAYSGFMDNTQNVKTELDSKLQEKGITHLYVVGIATDVCVRWSVRDALDAKTGSYQVTIISDAMAPVMGDYSNHWDAIKSMVDEGAINTTTAEILEMSCPGGTSGATDASVAASNIPSLPLIAALAKIFRDV